MTALDLGDIQGYHLPNARHFVLSVRDSGGARAFLAGLVSGNKETPQVTTAEEWGTRPSYCLNVGVTWRGLQVMGLPDGILSQFPPSFIDGPTANAAEMGDTDSAAPENWVIGGPRTDAVHLVVSLHTDEKRDLCIDRWTKVLRKLFADYRLAELRSFDANALADDKVHFGYRDGIAQPRIKGAPGRQPPDMQPMVDPGEFLLGRGYTNHYHGNYLG
ncbi:MAG: hypothetical protein ABL996_20250, partial [Micropepsaceae bacterium]